MWLCEENIEVTLRLGTVAQMTCGRSLQNITEEISWNGATWTN